MCSASQLFAISVRKEFPMQTKIINIHHKENYDVYIGRGSLFGNPFKIGKDGDRDSVVELYRQYFYGKISRDAEFKRNVLALKGKTLGCYCKPQRCHGDIIAEYLEVKID